jgi:hypothetical protein
MRGFFKQRKRSHRHTTHFDAMDSNRIRNGETQESPGTWRPSAWPSSGPATHRPSFSRKKWCEVLPNVKEGVTTTSPVVNDWTPTTPTTQINQAQTLLGEEENTTIHQEASTNNANTGNLNMSDSTCTLAWLGNKLHLRPSPWRPLEPSPWLHQTKAGIWLADGENPSSHHRAHQEGHQRWKFEHRRQHQHSGMTLEGTSFASKSMTTTETIPTTPLNQAEIWLEDCRNKSSRWREWRNCHQPWKFERKSKQWLSGITVEQTASSHKSVRRARNHPSFQSTKLRSNLKTIRKGQVVKGLPTNATNAGNQMGGANNKCLQVCEDQQKLLKPMLDQAQTWLEGGQKQTNHRRAAHQCHKHWKSCPGVQNAAIRCHCGTNCECLQVGEVHQKLLKPPLNQALLQLGDSWTRTSHQREAHQSHQRWVFEWKCLHLQSWTKHQNKLQLPPPAWGAPGPTQASTKPVKDQTWTWRETNKTSEGNDANAVEIGDFKGNANICKPGTTLEQTEPDPKSRQQQEGHSQGCTKPSRDLTSGSENARKPCGTSTKATKHGNLSVDANTCTKDWFWNKPQLRPQVQQAGLQLRRISVCDRSEKKSNRLWAYLMFNEVPDDVKTLVRCRSLQTNLLHRRRQKKEQDLCAAGKDERFKHRTPGANEKETGMRFLKMNN